MKLPKKMKRGDFIILGLASLAASLLFIIKPSDEEAVLPENELVAKINRDGKLIRTIDLNAIEETEYVHFDEGIKVVIEAGTGSIRFLSSECPDQTCVHTGWLTKHGQVAACLPSKTIITL